MPSIHANRQIDRIVAFGDFTPNAGLVDDRANPVVPLESEIGIARLTFVVKTELRPTVNEPETILVSALMSKEFVEM